MKVVTFTNEEAGAIERASRVGALLNDGEYILEFALAIRGGGSASDSSKTANSLVNPLTWFDLDGAWLKRAREVYDEIAETPQNLERAREGGLLTSRSTVRLLAPVPRPGKLIAIGLNYRDHAADSKMPIPERPAVISEITTPAVGSNARVVLPPTSEQADCAAELAVVAG